MIYEVGIFHGPNPRELPDEEDEHQRIVHSRVEDEPQKWAEDWMNERAKRGWRLASFAESSLERVIVVMQRERPDAG